MNSSRPAREITAVAVALIEAAGRLVVAETGTSREDSARRDLVETVRMAQAGEV